MQIQSHCPHCSRALQVPQGSSGHHARCPACHVVFVIPSPRELEEETFSAWIEEEVAQAMQERDEERAAPPATKAQEPTSIAPAKPAAAPAPDKPTPKEVKKTITATIPDPAAAPSLARPAAQVKTAEAPTAAPATSTPKPVIVVPPPPPRTTAPPVFTGDLRAGSNQPHMAILECTARIVRVAFDAQTLNSQGFRASMPVRCCVCGSDNRQTLLVRPVVFPDQVRGSVSTGRHVESHHQHHLQANQSPRDLLGVMGELTEMEKPFHLPMPYFICGQCTAESLQGRTRKREDGGLTCELDIRCGQYALDWLGRVNGVCGEDYATLEEEVSLMNSDAWRVMPEHVRKRLEVWCDFAPGERFIAYFSDADFGSRDAGLAGLVVTSQRLLFNKYHHHARLNLTDPAALFARAENEVVASLTLHAANHRTRLGKYKRTDMEQLTRVLLQVSSLSIDESGQPGEEEALAAG